MRHETLFLLATLYCTEDMLEVIHGKKREDILLPSIPEAAEIISWQERNY
jgi:hypothetical protein